MATAAISGAYGAFLIRESGAGSDTRVAEIVDWTISVTRQDVNATSKDSAGWEEALPGYRSATWTATARYNASASQAKLWTALLGDTATVWNLTGKFDTNAASGSDRYSGTCFVTKFDVTSPDGAEVVELSLEGKFTGAVTKGTVS